MAQTMQDLQDALTVQAGKIVELQTTLTDLVSDQKAAFDVLKAAIAAGSDTTQAVAAVAASITSLDGAIAAIKAADVDAEAESGTPTP